MNEEERIRKDIESIVKKNPYMSFIPIEYKNFIYEERVKINCFYCSKYDTKWTCPPRIPKLDYQKILSEYEHLAIIKYARPFAKEDFDVVRNESTNDVHRMLLNLERVLYNCNHSMAISFIGGSCKLCKNGCGKTACNNPGQARIPLEATGVNIIKSLEQIGIKIEFPIKDVFYRFGLLAW